MAQRSDVQSLNSMDWKERFEVAVIALMQMECRAETAERLLRENEHDFKLFHIQQELQKGIA